MKILTVPASVLEFGWEPSVIALAQENGVQINSKERYQQVRELGLLILKIEEYTKKQEAMRLALRALRQKRDQLKREVGWRRSK